jgi:uncharacterized protein DUF4038/collagenase-like protein with putative collagen-binding domain
VANLRLSNGLDAQPFAIRINSSGRFLEDQAGHPVLLVGDAAWSGIIQLTSAQMDTYLQDRIARGFNTVIVELIEHLFGAHSPNNIDSVAPFTGANFTTPNPTYFASADHFIQKAESLGITVILFPLYIGFSGTEEGWDTEIAAASTGDMQTWGEYCGNRYKNYNNIIWCIGGDRDATSFLTKMNSFVTGLQNYDTRHLVTCHDAGNGMAKDHLAGASWLTVNNIYATYLNTPGLASTAYAVSPVLPFFHIEGWYENENGMTAQNLRAQMYWAQLGGACGHIFGNDPIWNFAYDGVTSDWTNALDDPGSVAMTHYGSLFNSVAWERLAPDGSHTILTSGYGTIGAADFASCAFISGVSLAIIYMPSNRTMAVDMSQFSGTVTARWYDPTNGSYTADAASPLANSGSHNFSRATANNAGAADWVLVLST